MAGDGAAGDAQMSKRLMGFYIGRSELGVDKVWLAKGELNLPKRWVRINSHLEGISMQRRLIGALATGLAAWLTMLATPASAATISYTITGTTMNDGYINGHPDPVPSPQPFSMTLYFDDYLPPTADGRTHDELPDDPRDSYTIGGQRAFYAGLGGSVWTDTDTPSGVRELVLSGDTIVDLGFFKWHTGYQFVLESTSFSADYTLPGVFTDANAQLNRATGFNTSITQTFIPITGYSDGRVTYLDVDKLVITNSDYPSVVPPAVPLPASLPMFGAALAMLGFIGFGMKRAAITPADRVIYA